MTAGYGDPEPPVSSPVAPSAGRHEVGRSREDLLAQVVAAVEAVPGVAGLNGGPFGEIATYLPGRRVSGLRLRPDAETEGGATSYGGAEVHVSLVVGRPIRETAAQVRSAVAALVPGPVDVVVEDVVEESPDDLPKDGTDGVAGSTVAPAPRPT